MSSQSRMEAQFYEEKTACFVDGCRNDDGYRRLRLRNNNSRKQHNVTNNERGIHMSMPLDLYVIRHGESEANVIVQAGEQGDNSLYTQDNVTVPDRSWRLTALSLIHI